MRLSLYDIFPGKAGRLTKEQKKIIYIFAIAAVFFISFWVFVYYPQSIRFKEIKRRLAETESQISYIMDLTAGKEMAHAVSDLQDSLRLVAGRLPASEEVILNNLLSGAKKLKIEVMNISPESRHQEQENIPTYNVDELPFMMNMSSDFRALGEYLNLVSASSFPVLIRLRRLEIRSGGEGQSSLNITLHISAYLSKAHQDG